MARCRSLAADSRRWRRGRVGHAGQRRQRNRRPDVLGVQAGAVVERQAPAAVGQLAEVVDPAPEADGGAGVARRLGERLGDGAEPRRGYRNVRPAGRDPRTRRRDVGRRPRRSPVDGLARPPAPSAACPTACGRTVVEGIQDRRPEPLAPRRRTCRPGRRSDPASASAAALTAKAGGCGALGRRSATGRPPSGRAT